MPPGASVELFAAAPRLLYAPSVPESPPALFSPLASRKRGGEGEKGRGERKTHGLLSPPLPFSPSPRGGEGREKVTYLAMGLAFFSVGKLLGMGSVTAPVAAHSVPRASVVTKPTQRMPVRSWPIGVWNTRPLP